MKLIVENIELARGARPIVTGLSFTVSAGEALVLTGPNGAGKSTLLRALAGLFTPSAGSIRLEGGGEDATTTGNCHFVGHHNALKPALTATENLAFWAGYLGGSAAPAADPEAPRRALARLGLESLAAIPSAYMSAGQKRRLGLARLLAVPRPLWLLDEPTVSLDAASAALLGRIVNEHVASGGLAVAATHLPLGLDNARELRLTPPDRRAEAL